MMTKRNQNVTHYSGNTKILRVKVVDQDDDTLPADLTAPMAVRWWLAKKVTSTGADIFVQKSLGQGITLDYTNGFWFIVIEILPEDTEDVPNGNWYHEVEIINA